MSATAAIPNSVQLKQILYLTDFSRASEAALPVALGVARSHGSTIHVLHVITAPLETYPESLKADREIAEGEMKTVDVRLRGVTHDTSVTHAFDLWSGIERFIAEHGIDLVVIGTHGRTGAERLLLGSAADEIFRRSPVPVMTVGPDVKHEPADNGALDRILFATDFSPRSAAALPFAIALAKENHSRLLLLHALSKQRGTGDGNGGNRELSVAEAFHQLHQMLPGDLALPQSPDFAVEFGRPGDAIIAAAEQRGACVIILGIRGAEGRLGVASHLDRATAHKVVAHAPCPVLTVRA
jgi:nucleotide-binding universal stress UspA family protein